MFFLTNINLTFLQLLSGSKEKNEACYRTLVALGTLVSGSEVSQAAALSQPRLLASLTSFGQHEEGRIREAAAELLAVIQG